MREAMEEMELAHFFEEAIPWNFLMLLLVETLHKWDGREAMAVGARGIDPISTLVHNASE